MVRKFNTSPEPKNITADDMSRLLSNGQPQSTHESNYVTETLLEMYDIEELLNGTFPLKFTNTDHYQPEDPSIKPK